MMLRKVLILLMTLVVLERFLLGGYILYTVNFTFHHIPQQIYYSTGAVVVLGLILLLVNFFRRVSYGALRWFFIANGLSVIFNLVYFKVTARAELSTVDLIFMGTLFDIILMVVLPNLCQKAIKKQNRAEL